MEKSLIKILVFSTLILFSTSKTTTENVKNSSPRELEGTAATGTEEEAHEEAVHLTHGHYIILFIFTGIFLGAVLREIKKKTNFPYTPMLLIIGGIVGYFDKSLWIFGEATALLNQIDPHVLLMVFIPGLVFEGAYNSDGYVMGKSKWQVLLLAGPGVLIPTFMLAFGLKYIFGYSNDITTGEAMVIGSIISTTDPVAVVALLKELGTSIKFNTLLEGESMLNDGTAFVFFLVCLDIVKNGSFEFWPALVKFLRLSLGGPLFGLIVGWLSTFWLHRILKDNTLTVVITMFSAYLIFFFSETYLQVSGILGLVTYGIYLGTYARNHFTHDSDHAVHTVWSFCGFILETLLFLFTGAFIGEKIQHFGTFELEYNDIWKSVLYYFYVMIVRYVVMLMQYPILNLIGYKVSCLSALILSYGGLRGAIALSLGMVVALDSQFNQRFRDLCIFNIFVIIVLTVLINGLTIKWVMRKTGFLKVDEIKVKLKSNLVRELILESLNQESLMKHDRNLIGTDWKDVENLVHLANYKVLKGLTKEKYSAMMNDRKRGKNKKTSKIEKHSKGAYHAKNGEENILFKGNSMEEGVNANIVTKKVTKSKNKHEDEEVRSPLKPKKGSNDTNSKKSEDEESDNGSIGKASEDIGQLVEDPFRDVSSLAIKKELRLRIYKLIKHHVHEKHDNHECTSDVVRTVKSLCSICSDHPDRKICLSDYANIFIANYTYLEFLFKLSKIPIIGKLILKSLAKKVFYEYQFLDTLITIATEIGEDISEIPMNAHYKNEAKEIKLEILSDVDKLLVLEDSLVAHFSSLIGYIRTKLAAYSLIQFQRKQIAEFEHLGMLDGNERDNWLAKLDQRIVEVNL